VAGVQTPGPRGEPPQKEVDDGQETEARSPPSTGERRGVILRPGYPETES